MELGEAFVNFINSPVITIFIGLNIFGILLSLILKR